MLTTGLFPLNPKKTKMAMQLLSCLDSVLAGKAFPNWDFHSPVKAEKLLCHRFPDMVIPTILLRIITKQIILTMKLKLSTSCLKK